jgi:putative membrane protein
VSDEAAAADTAPLIAGERTHPLGLLIGFITGIPQLIFPMLAALFGTRGTGVATPLIIGGVLLISLLFRWIGWLRFRYHLDDDDIRIEQGLINRTVRSIPYDRIQDVSIEQPVLAQIFGLGEVKFETGGGEGEDAKLSFVGMDRAAALRETIRARKADDVAMVAERERTGLEREAPPLFAMDNGRLVTLGLYSFSLVIFAVLGGLAQQFDFLLPYDIWDFKDWIGLAEDRGVSIDGISTNARIIGAVMALLALIALGFATGIVRTFLKEYGFRLDRTERGFRRRRGLFTKTDVAMPINRVQAASIVTGPIRKRRGWHALKFVSLAQDSKDESDYVAAPLAQLDEIWPLVSVTGLTPPNAEMPFRKSRFLWWTTGLIVPSIGMIIATIATIIFAGAPFSQAGWMLLIPVLLLMFAWLEWRHYADAADGRQLYLREGWWRQKLAIAPQVNVQSAEIRQGPIARLLGLSTLEFGIAGGTLAFTALPLPEARALRDSVMVHVVPVDFSQLSRNAE